MSMTQAATAFQEGMYLYEHQEFQRALQKLKEAVDLDRHNPKYLTTLGITVARLQKNFELAEQLCRRAVRKGHKDPQVYINLAEVYMNSGNKQRAMDTLRNGLKFTKRNERIKEQIRVMGMRRPPVFPSLGRDHPVNMFLGKVRHVLLPKPKVH